MLYMCECVYLPEVMVLPTLTLPLSAASWGKGVGVMLATQAVAWTHVYTLSLLSVWRETELSVWSLLGE